MTPPTVAHPALVTDSSLSALTVTGGNVTPLGPSFDPAVHRYQVVTTDDTTVTVTPTRSDSGATIAVAVGGSAVTLTSGAATVPLVRGRNDVTVTVTSADTSSTTVYLVSVWRGVAPTSTVVSVADPSATILGGTTTTLTMRDGTVPLSGGNGWGCVQSFAIGAAEIYPITESLDPVTGLTSVVLLVWPLTRTAGLSDITVSNDCYVGSLALVANSVDRQAFVVTDDYQITGSTIPDPVAAGSAIVLRGHGVANPSEAHYWIQDAAGHQLQLSAGAWAGNGTAVLTVSQPDSTADNYAYYAGSGPRTFHVGVCPVNVYVLTSACTSIYSRPVAWQAPVPSDVSFTPAAGPLSGGTRIRIRGRSILASHTNHLVVTVGGQNVPSSDWTIIDETDLSSSFTDYSHGDDVLQVLAPARAVPGSVPVTVSTDFGTTVARGMFTYAARPVISSVSPSRVADTGGSAVTLTGTGFGTSGTPTVIIGGAKSPLVHRSTDGLLTAVVPADGSTTGPVDVQVSSAQGGGVSDPTPLTLTAPGAGPVITTVAPAAGQIGDPVSLTGSGFGPPGTVGVSVDGVWAQVTGSTATSVSFEVPATDTSGVKDLVVASTTGLTTRTGGFTVQGPPGIATVTPSTVASYASGSDAQVTLDGVGFAASGTVSVAGGLAEHYASTLAGTRISGITVPTTTAGQIPIVVTPVGSSTPMRASVVVTGPVLTYVGSDPYQAQYRDLDLNDVWSLSSIVFSSLTTGGVTMRVQGTGFGTGGVLTIGTATVSTTSWTDTAITFVSPAQPAGSPTLTVRPTGSQLTATRLAALRYVAAVALPTVTRIASVTDLGHADRDQFDPSADLADTFTVTGTNLAGTDSSATRVVVANPDGSDPLTQTPTAVSATSLTFTAPRTFTTAGWKQVTVVTDLGQVVISTGLEYLGAGISFTLSPYYGLCLRTPAPASGSLTDQPAVITISNTGGLFGDAGTVTFDGLAVTPTSYAAGAVTIDLADLPSDLTVPWGDKTIVITPSDTSLPAQRAGFLCAVTPTVTTTVNGATTASTIAAGIPYTLGFTTTGVLTADPFTVTAPGGYEYVTAADYTATGFTADVQAGAPVGAGDYWVRVSVPRVTYPSTHYFWQSDVAPVHVTITGTPVTVTPVSASGASLTYRGQLGDGTDGSPADLHYTATTTADPITGVVWEYRNSTCATTSPPGQWTQGLPKDVALATSACGGDGTSLASWDVRVKSVEMTGSGTDRSIFYQPTLPSIRITIHPRDLTIAASRADRVYDGTTTAVISAPTLSGVVDGDDVGLAAGSPQGSFADATVGVNKPVTLAGPLTLTGGTAGDYHLTNPEPTVLGTISKASAALALAVSPGSVLLSAATPVTVTATVLDTRTGLAPGGSAGLAPVVLTSRTPSVCTISGTTVTAHAAGVCRIAGSQAASVNYTAATAVSDPTSTTETVSFTVFPAPQPISVIADDLTIAVGDTLAPTSQVTGLFDGDSVDGINYRYYRGATLLGSDPSTPGTYRVVPYGATLTATDPAAYTNPNALGYVAGTLVITALPPTITTITPLTGPAAGGTQVTITGTRLDTVRSVQIGAVTLRASAQAFTVNPDGTTLTFATPRVAGPGPVALTLVAGTATAADIYTYTANPRPPTPPAPRTPHRTHPAPLSLHLNLAVRIDTRLVGAKARLTGGGLKPGAPYTLTMHSQTVLVTQGRTDPHGNFSQLIEMPGKACVRGGLHELVLAGIAPNGHPVTDTQWLVLDDTCHVIVASHTKPAPTTLLGWFLFDNLSSALTPQARTLLTEFATTLHNARTITITGYTQTDQTTPISIWANKILALNRADTVRAYLRAHGVTATMLTLGKGPIDPVSTTDQRLNRRVVVNVTY